MTRQNSALEFNSFIKGLITEASPLTFPANASLDERNFVLLRDGSRRRRLGMDIEENSSKVTSIITKKVDGGIDVSSFKWVDTGDDADVQISVVQMNNQLFFFDLSITPLSDGLIFTKVFTNDGGGALNTKPFTYANVDGYLIVATGQKEINIFKYDSGTITHSTDTLKIRDLFGLEDYDSSGTDLREGNGVTVRPVDTSTFGIYGLSNHIYNLRNQGWGVLRRIANDENLESPIDGFFDSYAIGSKRLPSNSDTVGSALYADPEDGDDRVGDRFWPNVLKTNAIGTSEAPRGYFIINALDRGVSREEAATLTGAGFPIYSYNIDSSTKGATVVESFAGRVWYGGFTNEVVEPDEYSPRLSSYIMFSQLVDHSKDITKCYQEADPTSTEDPDLVDTDGGFLRISGAEQIVYMKAIGTSLVVFATNGVWAITGGSDYGFSATNYKVDKLSDVGCVSATSIAQLDVQLVYWANDGIYAVSPSELGGLRVENISSASIKSFYQMISQEDKASSRGFYDKFDRKIRWLYGIKVGGAEPVMELVYDIDLNAYYVNEIGKLVTRLPVPIGMVSTSPFTSTPVNETVTVDGVDVTVDGEDVYTVESITQYGLQEILYIIITDDAPAIKFNFAKYRRDDFKDWYDIDGIGSETQGYLVTGYIPSDNADKQRVKQVPSLTLHFKRTETGFYEDEEGNLQPANPSSCIVQAQWDWTNSANSNRWSKPFQGYRYRRLYFPSGADDEYDTGHLTIVTKNVVRGSGRVVSFYFRTEPGKDCHILGWSMIMGMNTNV